ncbi:MAG TPA: hypothetical protein VM241_03620 [Candidatus Thermoplasmatota archaeon]|nr:hypothetical protein [Candidatus Thermoplasmatota archaeon]
MRALHLGALFLLAVLPAAAAAQPPLGDPVESYGCFAGGATFKVFGRVVLWECLGARPEATGVEGCGAGVRVVADGHGLTPCLGGAASAQPAGSPPPLVEFGECDGPYGNGPAVWVLGIRVVCITP